MVKFKKPFLLSLGILIFWLLITAFGSARESRESVSSFPVGNIHFHRYTYRVIVENYGRGKITVVLYPEGAPAENRYELSFYEWQSFVDEVEKINRIVVKERVKETLSVKDFLEIKEIVGEENVKVSGIAKGVKIVKGLFFYYTVFILTDEEENYFKVSLEGKHKIPEGKKVIVEGKYSEYDKEFKARRVSR